ncbi:MAG: DUF6199 family natural product biosynthesis protein [Bacillota bacterium]
MLSIFIEMPGSYLAAAGNLPRGTIGSLLFFSVLLLVVGLISILYPRLFWYLRIGRKVEGIEPSSLYLGVLRIGGMMVFALGAVILYYTFFS